jgi:hypothetical protein
MGRHAGRVIGMGEYANVRATGERVKLGTCEDLYGLRFGDRDQVYGYEPWSAELLSVVRFRFPWPDEDGASPGMTDAWNRGLTLWGFEQPADVEHGSVQWSARNGYLMSLPCPEGSGEQPARVARNGYGGPASLVGQALRGGRLVGIVRCNACERQYRLEDGFEDAAAACIRSMADDEIGTADRNGTEGNRAIGERLHLIADRLLAGYSATMPAAVR